MDNRIVRVLYLFAGERGETIKKWKIGEGPDSYLIGYNHMAGFGIQADYIENKFINWIRKINFNLANLILIRKIREYDVVFSGGSLALPFVAKVILRFKKPKFVWYNTFFTNALKRNDGTLRGRIIKRTILSLDAIVCPSTAQKDFLIEIGCDPKKVFYVPNGVDVSFIENKEKEMKVAAHAPFILSVGKDMGRDYATLIEAVRGLDISVKVIAYPRNFKNIKDIPGNVSVETVPFLRLLELYKEALAVVIPTKKDSYFNASDCSGQSVLLEAMASGKAIIASERETLDDYVKDGETALMVPPEDVSALKATILRLSADKKLVESIETRVRVLAERQFTTRRLAEDLSVIFTKVTDEK